MYSNKYCCLLNYANKKITNKIDCVSKFKITLFFFIEWLCLVKEKSKLKCFNHIYVEMIRTAKIIKRKSEDQIKMRKGYFLQ